MAAGQIVKSGGPELALELEMPPDLVAIDEIGEILSIKSLGTVEVKFRRGSFLIDTDRIEKI